MILGSGSAMITPSRAVTKEIGAPQPSSSIGPATKPPCCGGKIASQQAAGCVGAAADRVLGEQQGVGGVVVHARRAARRSATVRSMASRPPTAFRVKPNDSWIAGVNSHRQHQHERERVGADQAEGLDLDRAEREVERAAVLAPVMLHEAAAVHQAGVDAAARRRWAAAAPG